MSFRSWRRRLAGRAAITLFTVLAGCAQPGPMLADAPPLRTLEGVHARAVTLVSEGTRIAGTVYTPAATSPQARLPTLVMAAGWGRVAQQLEADAVEFARAGYLVLAFDYRGWGRSDARVLLTRPAPHGAGTRYTAEVQEVREVIDPQDMADDWLAALHWLHGEAQCDTARIGLWGAGISGGLVVSVAARDPRVKAVYSQVGLFATGALASQTVALHDATRLARGEIGYPSPAERQAGSLRGAAVLSRFAAYSPLDDVSGLGRVPLAVVVVRDEDMLDNREHGLLAHERHPGPKRLVMIETSHHGIDVYGARREAHAVAQDWFDRYVKGP
jgi:dienelactone hydrolase